MAGVLGGGAERRSDCFSGFTPVELASGPTAPPGRQPEQPQALLTPAGVLPGLERCRRDGLMPRQSHSGQEGPGLPLVSVSSANSQVSFLLLQADSD